MPGVLVVEDDADIAALIAHYLEKSSYSPEVVADGSRALARAREAPPDLVILDLMLPGLNGLEVCRALRADTRTAALPIIMLTARGDESERIFGLDAGDRGRQQRQHAEPGKNAGKRPKVSAEDSVQNRVCGAKDEPAHLPTVSAEVPIFHRVGAH